MERLDDLRFLVHSISPEFQMTLLKDCMENCHLLLMRIEIVSTYVLETRICYHYSFL